MVDVVDFAYQILAMRQRIEELECENDRLKEIEEEYNKLLDSSLSHAKAMAANMLRFTLTNHGRNAEETPLKKLFLNKEKGQEVPFL